MNADIQNIPIFLVTNTDMVGYTATTMVSVAVNTKHDVSFYIMDCGLSDFDRKQLRSLEGRFPNIVKMVFSRVDVSRFEGLSVWYYGLLDAWAMLLFPESFPEVDKVVHIESDTIVLDDIAKLYNDCVICNIDQSSVKSACCQYGISYSHFGHHLIFSCLLFSLWSDHEKEHKYY